MLWAIPKRDIVEGAESSWVGNGMVQWVKSEVNGWAASFEFWRVLEREKVGSEFCPNSWVVGWANCKDVVLEEADSATNLVVKGFNPQRLDEVVCGKVDLFFRNIAIGEDVCDVPHCDILHPDVVDGILDGVRVCGGEAVKAEQEEWRWVDLERMGWEGYHCGWPDVLVQNDVFSFFWDVIGKKAEGVICFLSYSLWTEWGHFYLSVLLLDGLGYSRDYLTQAFD